MSCPELPHALLWPWPSRAPMPWASPVHPLPGNFLPPCPGLSSASDDMEGIESRQDAFFCRKVVDGAAEVGCRRGAS